MTYQHDHTLALRSRLLAGFALILGGVTTARATIEWHDVQIGGFASQGFLDSSANDFLGTTHTGDPNFREYALNGSYAFGPVRVGAQVFGERIADYGGDRPELDWAQIDYHPFTWFGVRVGRVKTPHGLYNEALDLDEVRASILMPMSVYDARLRDFNAAFNGGMGYGNVDLHKFGSLDYTAFYGKVTIPTDSGANVFFNDSTIRILGPIKMDAIEGATLFWNLPINGLRVGYSFSEYRFLNSLTYPVPTTTSKTNQPYVRATPSYPRHLFSVEYILGDWTFASEAGHEDAAYLTNTPPGLVNLTLHDRPSHYRASYFYFSAAKRINKWLQAGVYYDHFAESVETTSSSTTPGNIGKITQTYRNQDDTAVSLSFDVTEHLIIKLEEHFYQGAGKIWSSYERPAPTSTYTPRWDMFAAKATFVF